jgi:hypothetical protein
MDSSRLLRFEMLHGGENFKNDDFRQESSFSQIPSNKKAMLRLSPTYLHSKIAYNGSDYG